jgi:Ca2+-binding RTX toxin-like protein
VADLVQGRFYFQADPSDFDTLISIESVDLTGQFDMQLVGDDGANILSSDVGNDTITGAGGDDTIRDGAGNDSLSGGDGDDLFEASTGEDTFEGGAGTDTFFVDLSALTLPASLVVETNLATGFNGPQGGGGGVDTLQGIENVVFTGASVWGVDLSLSGDGNDNLLLASDGDDTLDGAAGDDTLDGGAGDDSISGGDGTDLIATGAGVDSVDAGAGDDRVTVSGEAKGTLEGGAGTGDVLAVADETSGALAVVFGAVAGAGSVAGSTTPGGAALYTNAYTGFEQLELGAFSGALDA